MKRDDWIVVGLAGLLLIDLLALPWISVSASVGTFSVSVSSTATGYPDGWLGVLAVIVLAAVLADLLVERLSPSTTLPNLGGSRPTTRLYLSIVAVALLALKLLLHLSGTFSNIGFGFIVAIVLSVGLLVATMRLNQDRPLLNS